MTDEKLINVCNEIALGASLDKACQIAGTTHKTFFTALVVDKDLLSLYAQARESRADARFERLEDLLEETKRGDVDPMVARVLIDAIKWQCGKEKARVYGDSHVIRGDKDNPITLQALASSLDERIKQRVIEDKS